MSDRRCSPSNVMQSAAVVRGADRRRVGRRPADDGQHPAAGGRPARRRAPRRPRSARCTSGHSARARVEARDDVAGLGLARIAAGCQHDADGDVARRTPARAGSGPPVLAAQQQRRQRLGEQRQHDLRLGIAEAAVELDHLGAVGGEHQPAVEEADETACPRRPCPPAPAATTSRSIRARAGRRSSARSARTRPCRRCWVRRRRRAAACGPAPIRTPRTARRRR